MKARRKHRPRRKEVEHWLSQGQMGQECLLDEISPLAFLTDSAICSIIQQAASRNEDLDSLPLLAIDFGDSLSSWIVPYCARWFDVIVVAEQFDQVLDEVVQNCGATVVSSVDSITKASNNSLFLSFQSKFASLHELRDYILIAVQRVAVGGQFVLPMPLKVLDEEMFVSGVGEQLLLLSELEGFLSSFPFRLSISHKILNDLINYSTKELTGAFIKRHENHFGKSAKEILRSRTEDSFFGTSNEGLGRHEMGVLEPALILFCDAR